MKIKYYNYLLALSLCFSMIIPSSTNINSVLNLDLNDSVIDQDGGRGCLSNHIHCNRG